MLDMLLLNGTLTHWVTALSLTFMHFLWQGVLIGALAWMALRIFRNAHAQLRYAIANMALLACVLVVLITLTTRLNQSMPPSFMQLEYVPRIGSAPLAAGIGAASSLAQLTFAPSLVAFWAVGSGLMYLRLLFGLASIKRLRRLPAAPHAWQLRMDQLAEKMGLRQVKLLLANGCGSPVSAGYWRPIVLLPAALLTRMPAQHIEALLAHELAHIRRHDYLFNLIQVGIESLLFFHPVVWWLSQQIRQEREYIADALAINAVAEPRTLALALARLADLSAEFDTATGGQLVQAGNGGALQSRIKRLFAARPQPPRLLQVLFVAFGLILSSLVIVACAHLAKDYAKPKAHSTAKHDRLSYALVRHDVERILAFGPDDDIDQVARSMAPRASDYVLIRRNGRDALVIEPTRVAALRRKWEHAQNLAAQASAHDSALTEMYAVNQTLLEQVASNQADDGTLSTFEKQSLELDQLVARAKKLDAQQNLAFARVEQQLRDVIARAPNTQL
jgi:beta-lactamase regulating signal transducer with metallopeptidase domain